MSRISYDQMCEQVEVLAQRVRDLEELTRGMRRDRAVRRVLAGQARPADLDAATFFFEGPAP